MDQKPPEQPLPGQKQVDELRLQMLLNQLRENQNLPLAVFGGAVASLAGAIVWAAITYFTGYQVGVVAIGLGFLVGITVRQLGKGIDKSFGITAAVLSLLGCAVGNLLAACALIAEQNDVSIMSVLGQLSLDNAWQVMVQTFNVFDVVFYALAAYYGYRISFRKLTEDEIKSVLR